MSKSTLTLNETVELPDDYERLLQSITLLAPVQKVDLNIDVTHKAVLPAVLESALLLVAQIETVSPIELGNFFGLEDNERQVLVEEMIDTGLVCYNDDGDIATTVKLNTQRRESEADEGITIEDIENYRVFTFVDLCTEHIQPKCDADLQKGLPELPRNINNKDFTDLITKQFDRFKSCLPDQKDKRQLRKPSTKLYRVNHASVARSGLKQMVSLDIRALFDPIKGIRLDARLMDYNDKNTRLMENSGLKTEAISWLNNRQSESPSSTLQSYCQLADDQVIRRYIKHNGELDIGRLLHDRHRKKTGYGKNDQQRMIIGPVYAASNRDTLLAWAKRLPRNKRTHHGIWLGATQELFGASLGLKTFLKEMNAELREAERHSSLNLAFKKDSKGFKGLENQFASRTDGMLQVFDKGQSESHLEIMVFPGKHGMAVIQYHASLDPSLGFARLALPIGYYTTVPEQVAHLWCKVQERIQSPLRSLKQEQDESLLDALNEQLECTPDKLGQLLTDKMEQKTKALMDKYNKKKG